MDELNELYEKELQKAIAKAQRAIRRIYEQSIVEITLKASHVKAKNKPFSLSLYPLLNQHIESKVKDMHKQIYQELVKSVEKAWSLSNKKNDLIIDKRLARKVPSGRAKQILYDPNKQAFESFIHRKEKGLNLSDRVWNLMDPFKKEMEQGLGLAINEGKAATSMATEIKKYLNEPDRLYRRVRNDQGQLVLSQAARQYHPGQGVYRSSYKNALRLSRTENNLAYRYSDHERWKSMPFITGIEIRLSKNHPRYDICDVLAGKYPKHFKWSGWHPQCLCHQVPIMLSDEEYSKLEDKILAGEKVEPAKGIVRPPDQFTNYVNENKERIAGWKNKPYWVRDNKEYFEGVKDFRNEAGMMKNIRFGKERNLGTLDLYTNNAGQLTPERKELHDSIVSHFLSKPTTKDGTIFTMGGAPANGKSTLTDLGLLPHPKKILKIDPDEIKGMLPEYARMVRGNDAMAAAFAHEESSYIGKRIIQEALKADKDFLIDGVGDGSFQDLNKKITSYRAEGKRVRGDYVTLDTDLSLKLADLRAKKTGREVPIAYIKEMNREISKLVPDLLKNNTFDEFYLWDTNLQNKPRLILTHIDGKTTIFDQKLYEDFLKKALR